MQGAKAPANPLIYGFIIKNIYSLIFLFHVLAIYYTYHFTIYSHLTIYVNIINTLSSDLLYLFSFNYLCEYNKHPLTDLFYLFSFNYLCEYNKHPLSDLFYLLTICANIINTLSYDLFYLFSFNYLCSLCSHPFI